MRWWPRSSQAMLFKLCLSNTWPVSLARLDLCPPSLYSGDHFLNILFINQLSDLLAYASEIYNGIYGELALDAQRIGSIGERIKAVEDFMPQLEDYIESTYTQPPPLFTIKKCS